MKKSTNKRFSPLLKSKPRTTEEHAQNKKTQQLAETIRAKRQIEIQNGVFGVNDLERINSSFLAYFELLTEKKKKSDGNYGNWRSALKHLKSFSKVDGKFVDIDIEWLEDLKYYFVNDARTKHNQKLSENSCSSYFNKISTRIKSKLNANSLIDLLKNNFVLWIITI